jgi:FtsH-binding integral membrane protein
MSKNPNQIPFADRINIAKYDEGLRAYMIKIYIYMMAALVVTGVTAWFAAGSEALLSAMYVVQDGVIVGTKPLAWIVMLAPLGLVVFLTLGMQRMSLLTAQVSFWIYAALVGLSLTTIFIIFTGESIARVFFITASVFAAMGLYGYTTKRDLTASGSFFLMGLFGIIIASLVNLFLKSSGLQFAISIIGILVFIGLTAYDTQKLKQMYYELSQSGEMVEKITILGALTFYLDFINLFLSFLNILGQRRQ